MGLKRTKLRVASVVAAVGTILMTIGCSDSTPQAPALRSSPVYQNESAGMRFMVPERWQQTANSTLPAGALEQEVLLTRYRLETSAHGASLEVLAMNTDANRNVLEYHLNPSFGISNWKVMEPPDTEQIGGETAQRMYFEGSAGKDGFGKEVYVVQRGSREFHFMGLFSMLDPNARQQIQRAVESVAWKDVR